MFRQRIDQAVQRLEWNRLLLVTTAVQHNGLILLSCGTSTVRFMPPLMITKDDVDEAFTILEASLVEALESL